MRHPASLLALGLLLTLGTLPSPAAAPRPFAGRVAATWDNIFNGLLNPPANFAGGGPVTHMGNTKQMGTLVLQAPIAPGLFPGSGSVTITAANGDTVSFDYVGLLDAPDGRGIRNLHVQRRHGPIRRRDRRRDIRRAHRHVAAHRPADECRPRWDDQLLNDEGRGTQ